MGEISAPWDRSTPSHKFTHKVKVYDLEFLFDTYFDKAKMGLKWISYVEPEKKTNYVIKTTGIKPATFTDANFRLKNCNSKIALDQLNVRHSSAEQDTTPVDLIEEAKKAAKEAITASKKAEVAANEAKMAAKRTIKAIKNLKRKSEEKDCKKHNEKFFE